MKRFLSLFLAIVMIFSLSLTSFAVVTETLATLVLSGAMNTLISELTLDIIGKGYSFFFPSDPGNTPISPGELTMFDIPSLEGESVPLLWYVVSDPYGYYHLKVPGSLNGTNFIGTDLVVSSDPNTLYAGTYHMTLEQGNSPFSHVTFIVDGTVVVYIAWYAALDGSREIAVVDYSLYDFTNLLYLRLSDIMDILYGNNGQLSSANTKLSNINTALSSIKTYLSAMNTNIADIETIASELSSTLGNIDTDLDDVRNELSSINDVLKGFDAKLDGFKEVDEDILDEVIAVRDKLDDCTSEITSILDHVSEDVEHIKDDVSESKSILATIRDKIDYVHLSIVDKLNELISAVRSIGGGGSSGSDGSSFIADLLGGVFGVAFEALKLLLNLIFNLLSSVFGFIARFSAFVTSLWSGFISSNILAILLVIPPLSFILGVINFIRG